MTPCLFVPSCELKTILYQLHQFLSHEGLKTYTLSTQYDRFVAGAESSQLRLGGLVQTGRSKGTNKVTYHISEVDSALQFTQQLDGLDVAAGG